MGSLLRTRRWIAFTLLVVIAIVGFGLLSRWQWERAEQRREERAAQDAQLSRDPVSLAEARATGREWMTVRVTGVFDSDATVLVRQRPLDGRNGFWVATPLAASDGRLWVVRGWIPSTATAAGTVAAPSAPQGQVTVEGRLRAAERSSDPEPSDLPRGQVSRVDPAALGSDVPDFYLEATNMSPPDSGVTPLPAPVVDETRNISYAIQWLIFAAIALVGWWFFLRREAREEDRQHEPDRAGAHQSSN